jgi:hypothetical protein
LKTCAPPVGAAEAAIAFKKIKIAAFGSSICECAVPELAHPQGALEKQYRLSLLQVLQCDSEEPCE